MTSEPVSAAPAGARVELIGIAAMAGGNALLVVNDTFVKLAASALPMSEVIFLRALVATALLFAIAAVSLPHGASMPRVSGILGVRAVFEVAVSFAYLYALQLIPIGELVGFVQVVPLVILAGAALVLGERIGLLGWGVALVGLAGALLIVRPGVGGTGASTIAGWGAVLAVAAVVFHVIRDLITRVLPERWPPAFVAGTSQCGMIVGGLCFAPFDAWVWPSAHEALQIAAAGVFLAIANNWLVTAMRSGRISVVGPFRYAGVLAALVSGFMVWGEFPDQLSMLGCAIIVLSGLASLWLRPRRASGVD